MNSTQKVVKNSFWLIVQPLLLNAISLFVIGYIARQLGQADYGKFIFAFAFIAIFSPLTNIGLSSITTREIAENRSNAGNLLGKMLMLRLSLSVAAFLIVVFSINIAGYPASTRMLVYIAAMTLICNAMTTTFESAFQAFEKVEYIALAQFISGFVLTVLSVVVLFLGYRVISLTAVYAFGSLLGTGLSLWYIGRKVALPRITIDLQFWKTKLLQGLPFFVPVILSVMGTKIGIIMLSRMAGDTPVGVYGAAESLIEKLAIIPDGVCTAFFPTMTLLFKNSREEAVCLFKKFFLYLLMLGLPIAVGTSILAGPIINLIYGSSYTPSILILRLLAWNMFVLFLCSIQGWTLGAVHREKKGLIVRLITTPLYVVLNLLMIPYMKATGVAVANIATNTVYFILLASYVRKYLTAHFVERDTLLKILVANGAMALVVFVMRNYNLIAAIAAGTISYYTVLRYLKVIRPEDIFKLNSTFFRKPEAVATGEAL